MAVKTAPEPGTVLEETKRTRVLTNADNDADKPWRTMSVWDYIASLNPTQWSEHVLYLYRYDDKGNTWALGKFVNAIDEFKVQETFGGGYFNLKVKKGPQLILNEDFRVEGNPKSPDVARTLAAPGASGSDSALLLSINALIEELRASRGGTTASDAIKQALTLNGQIFSSGAEALRNTLATPQHAPANSMKDTLEILAMAKNLFVPAGPATNSVKDTLEMISTLKSAGLFGDAGGGKINIATELIRQIPTVTQNLVTGIQAWQMAEEARARQTALLRGTSAPINVAPIPPAGMPPGPPPPVTHLATTEIPASVPPPGGAPGAQVPQMQIETLEQMLCDIIRDESLTTEQAAMEACALIERSMPGMTDQMIAKGEEWLHGLFSMRPVLQQVASHPRLRDFVTQFVKTVKAAPTIQPPNPVAPPA